MIFATAAPEVLYKLDYWSAGILIPLVLALASLTFILAMTISLARDSEARRDQSNLRSIMIAAGLLVGFVGFSFLSVHQLGALNSQNETRVGKAVESQYGLVIIDKDYLESSTPESVNAIDSEGNRVQVNLEFNDGRTSVKAYSQPVEYAQSK